jgi:enamine deaminase RidA (YjgF/YER057c/UK114 family)
MTNASHGFRAASRFFVAALFLAPVLWSGGVEGQEVFPLAGAPYAAGVMAPAGATLAVIGGIEGEGSDVGAAAAAALGAMEARLSEVGLDRSHVLKVRAGLAPGDGTEFTAWDGAWRSFYGSGQLPARTTVGSSGVPGNARIVLDVVAAFPLDRGHRAAVDGARATANPNLSYAGPAGNPTAIVATSPGLFLSSGVLPNRNSLANPEAMEDHMRGAMNGLANTLADHGLAWADAFFVRVLPTPQPDRATVDFAGWSPVFDRLSELSGGQGPAWTMWAAPGFGTGNNPRFVEIEVWAVPQAPMPAFEVLDRESQNPNLRMTGTGFIAAGAMVAPYPELVFLSGIVAPEGTAPTEEGMSVLTQMEERLSLMGATMADVAELRVYRVAGEEGFNDAYGLYFNNAERNPHRPVRTNYVVQSLPGGRTVEVEALVVRPPQGF